MERIGGQYGLTPASQGRVLAYNFAGRMKKQANRYVLTDHRVRLWIQPSKTCWFSRLTLTKAIPIPIDG